MNMALYLGIFALALTASGYLFFVTSPRHATTALTRGWRIILCLALPLGALIWYWQQGSASSWLSYATQRAAIAKQTPSQLIATLRAATASHPKEAEGWYWLGRVYFSQQQYAQAAESFSRAAALQPDSLALEAEAIQARYWADQQKMTPALKRAIERVLKKDPQQPLMLNLLAVDAWQQQHYDRALQLWETLKMRYPADSAEAKALASAIAAAEKHVVASSLRSTEQ